MKKVISLLTLIFCAMLIITGCDPATTTPGTGGNTTLPSNPDDNPLIPDDKPSDDTKLPAPVESQENIINNLYEKLKNSNAQETKTATVTSERTFENSVYEASPIDEVKSFIANGNLSLLQTGDIGVKINGKVEIKIKDSEETHIYEAKDLELIPGSEGVFEYKNGELIVDGKLLTKEEIAEDKYIIVIAFNNDFNPYKELQLYSAKRELSSDGFSLQEVFIGSIGGNNAKATDALIVKDNEDTLKIGIIFDMASSSETPVYKLDYVSVNGEYISVEKCSSELKETLFGFVSIMND